MVLKWCFPAIFTRVIPLALSGTIVLGGGVGGALLLVWALLRGEAREDAEEQAEQEAAAKSERERISPP
jgi:hypothetical protein